MSEKKQGESGRPRRVDLVHRISLRRDSRSCGNFGKSGGCWAWETMKFCGPESLATAREVHTLEESVELAVAVVLGKEGNPLIVPLGAEPFFASPPLSPEGTL